MTSFKKIFAAATAAATVGVLSLASMTASATEIPAVENPPYTVYMSVQAGAEQAWAPEQGANVSVPGDGTYTLEYTFTLGSATIEALILDSNINAYSFAPEEASDPIAQGTVAMSIDSVVLKKTDGSPAAITYNGPSNGAFRTGDNGSCIRYNVLNNWTNPKVADIAAELPGEGAGEGDVLSVTFTITGLDNGGGGGEGEGGTTTTTTTTTTDAGGNGGTTTTTTTKAQSSGGVVNNNNSVATTKVVSNSTTGTVSQTADAGVVAIVVGAAAAASLAVGAMTIKRKRK